MTAQKALKRVKGFTLVELLIVIAILAIIALIVIAAINPIEQANRARDTGMKADGSQLVSAIDRYFTARFEFPWVSSNPTAYDNESSFGFVSAQDADVGLLGVGGSAGLLISTEELKPEFGTRNFMTTTSGQDMLAVGKDASSTSSVYACYVPMSKANRDRACADGNVFSLNNDGTRTSVDCSTSTPTDWYDSSGDGGGSYPGIVSGSSYYVCVPE